VPHKEESEDDESTLKEAELCKEDMIENESEMLIKESQIPIEELRARYGDPLLNSGNISPSHKIINQ
jgi:hypothetical protein